MLGLVKSLAAELAATSDPGQRGGTRPDRHAAAGRGLAVARARLPGHAAARAAGPAGRDRRDGLLPGDRGRHVLRRGPVAERRGGDLRWPAEADGQRRAPWSPARPRAWATRRRCGWPPTASRSRSTTSPTTGGCPTWPRRIGGLAVPADIADPERRRRHDRARSTDAAGPVRRPGGERGRDGDGPVPRRQTRRAGGARST